MLIDETSSSFPLPGVPSPGSPEIERRSWISIGKRFGPTIEFNLTGRAGMLRFKALLLAQEPRPVVLNVGGKHAGSFASMVATDPAVDCTDLHVAFAPPTSLIADPHHLPLADGLVYRTRRSARTSSGGRRSGRSRRRR